MFRSSVSLVSLLYVGLALPLATAAVPKTVLDLQQMTGKYVEHRVEQGEARAVASALHPELSDGRPGCEVCTREEVEYCAGNAVVEDHCCCDMRHFEWFPYVPHTCYLRPGCSPIAGNCARYARLRVCCCEAVTAAKWKSEAGLLTMSWRILMLCSVCVLIVR
ncbi:uncharacterized protein LOC110831749 [Zootermopsis nevadensis]|uniref:CCC domain-containing protein n=1 Tax=Zootermopsis nevadensis TaxID=136037 RepID=A0A067RJ73_ZOONE|nr:uncharacterized protein LOC110831749 [Zootermopsis nevadensis]KDR23926.1 hypothetical protein L798_10799 [Zootermopsis nevadensis]